MNPPVTTCTPKTCASLNTVCGPVSDGCGGTLECGTCSGSSRCVSGQCEVDACAQAGAVCGSIGTTQCGMCANGSTCSSDQRQCIETLATATSIGSAVVANDSLYLSTMSSSVIELNLTSGERREVITGQMYLSPLTTNGTHLFYASSTGLHRVSVGTTAVEDLTGLNGSCFSLLADAQYVYCGTGGDPRYGVSYYGIDRVPVAGGVRSDVVSSLNYPRMAKWQNLLFHVGTTDNYSSFAVMGVTDLSDMSGQSLVSGGPLGRLVLADSDAFYFLDGQKLTRAPYDNSMAPALAEVTQLRQETTIADGTAVFAIGEVAGQGGLYKMPVSGGPAVKLLGEADFGGDSNDVVALIKLGDQWLIVTSSAVFRVRG
jgi:hypothetical protein